MAHLLELDGLRTEIRLRRAVVHALDGVSLTVDPGECLGIVGVIAINFIGDALRDAFEVRLQRR